MADTLEARLASIIRDTAPPWMAQAIDRLVASAMASLASYDAISDEVLQRAARNEILAELQRSDHPQALDERTLMETMPLQPAPLPPRHPVRPAANLDTLNELSAKETERYTTLGELGTGGMGSVLRVKDRKLNRIVAMKVLHKRLLQSQRGLAQFQEEAQVAGQLQHPGIVPVFDIGRLDDGRVYFTMKEVKGHTLHAIGRAMHQALSRGIERTADGWSLRRLVSVFLRVCETVAYAHSRAVIHRDLKPANVMVGDYGEVLVLDWGIAKVLADSAPRVDRVESRRGHDDHLKTMDGVVAGTPSFMAPEQARGDVEDLDARSDVYALGSVLYWLLAGRPPHIGGVQQILLKVASEAPVTPPTAPWPVPEVLADIAMRAMQGDPALRYPDAGALASAITDWLEGAERRERALARVTQAKALLPEVRHLRLDASRLRTAARTALARLAPDSPEQDKWPAWDLQDQAADLEADAAGRKRAYVEKLRSALVHDPELPEAHRALAEVYQGLHAEAEAHGDVEAARGFELSLRTHDRGQYDAYLKGLGAVTLVTEPPGAEVILSRFVERRRMLVPERIRSLGRTPLVEVPLERGSFLLTLSLPGHEIVHYPVYIERLLHWDGIRPGADEPMAIWLPPLGSLGEDEVYVPGGWSWSGGDNAVLDPPLPRKRLWTDGFIMQRTMVSNAQYADFLNDLLATGRGEEAELHQPRVYTDDGPTVCRRDADGRFLCGTDNRGGPWLPDVPVTFVSHAQAAAYAAWWADRTGQPWRLPLEREWEKAARGVDARPFPTGQTLDPAVAWYRTRDRPTNGPRPIAEDRRVVSLYGVQGLAGNLATWTDSSVTPQVHPTKVVSPAPLPDGEWVVCKGGSWNHTQFYCRSDARTAFDRGSRPDCNGIRLVRPVSPR